MSEDRKPRKPRAFALDQEPKRARSTPESNANSTVTPPRRPRAVPPGPDLRLEPEDYFEREDLTADQAVVETVERHKRRFSLASIALAAIGTFASLAVGLWIDSVVRTLFERNEWLGWFALCVAGVFGAALFFLVIREIAAIVRLRTVDHLREGLETALATSDERALRRATGQLIDHMAANPLSASGRAVLADQEDEILDAADRYALAERELFKGLDRSAFVLVMAASRRVSVVTAVSPRAVLDILYVLYENFRMVRRLCELYGGRTGTFGTLRLFRNVLGHLAVTGAASIGDGLIQQVLGHGMASRLSARLGEGVLNGMMTARVGLAAMEVCRPAPFHAVQRPRLSSVLSSLTSKAEEPTD